MTDWEKFNDRLGTIILIFLGILLVWLIVVITKYTKFWDKKYPILYRKSVIDSAAKAGYDSAMNKRIEVKINGNKIEIK